LAVALATDGGTTVVAGTGLSVGELVAAVLVDGSEATVGKSVVVVVVARAEIAAAPDRPHAVATSSRTAGRRRDFMLVQTLATPPRFLRFLVGCARCYRSSATARDAEWPIPGWPGWRGPSRRR
jgi:hypothetical protein